MFFLQAKLPKTQLRGALPGWGGGAGGGSTRATVAPGTGPHPSVFPDFRLSPTCPDFCYLQGKPQKRTLKIKSRTNTSPGIDPNLHRPLPPTPPCPKAAAGTPAPQPLGSRSSRASPQALAAVICFAGFVFLFSVHPPFSGQCQTKKITWRLFPLCVAQNLTFTALSPAHPTLHTDKIEELLLMSTPPSPDRRAPCGRTGLRASPSDRLRGGRGPAGWEIGKVTDAEGVSRP